VSSFKQSIVESFKETERNEAAKRRTSFLKKIIAEAQLNLGLEHQQVVLLEDEFTCFCESKLAQIQMEESLEPSTIDQKEEIQKECILKRTQRRAKEISATKQEHENPLLKVL